MAVVLSDAPVLGSIPSGLPAFQIPTFNFPQLNEMLVAAAVLAALGSIDSLLTSLVADNVTRSFHNSDKELVGHAAAYPTHVVTSAAKGEGIERLRATIAALAAP